MGAKDAPKTTPNPAGGTPVAQKQPSSQQIAGPKRSNGQPGASASRPGQFYHQYKNNKLLVQAQTEKFHKATASASLDDRVEQVTQMVRRNIIQSQNYKQLKFNTGATQASFETHKVFALGKRAQPNVSPALFNLHT